MKSLSVVFLSGVEVLLSWLVRAPCLDGCRCECFSVRLSVRERDQTISVAVKRIPKKTMEGSSDRMTPRRVLEVFMSRWLAWFAWCLANRGLIYRLPLPEPDQNLGFLPCPLGWWDLKEGADGIRLSAGQNRVFE